VTKIKIAVRCISGVLQIYMQRWLSSWAKLNCLGKTYNAKTFYFIVWNALQKITFYLSRCHCDICSGGLLFLASPQYQPFGIDKSNPLFRRRQQKLESLLLQNEESNRQDEVKQPPETVETKKTKKSTNHKNGIVQNRFYCNSVLCYTVWWNYPFDFWPPSMNRNSKCLKSMLFICLRLSSLGFLITKFSFFYSFTDTNDVSKYCPKVSKRSSSVFIHR